jgi:hypothetical protein
MNTEAPQNWQEIDGEVIPPDVQPEIAPNQHYKNSAELERDPEFDFHRARTAAVAVLEAIPAEAPAPPVKQVTRHRPPTRRTIGLAGVATARAALNSKTKASKPVEEEHSDVA